MPKRPRKKHEPLVLTQAQYDRYLLNPRQCPRCHGEDITGENVDDVTVGYSRVRMGCGDCEAVWEDVNDLTVVDIEGIELVQNKGKIDMEICDMVVTHDGEGGGSITSKLKNEYENNDFFDGSVTAKRLANLFDAAIDGLESLVLACACVGVDVETPEFKSAIETALEAIANHA